MKNSGRIAIVFAAASLCFAQATPPAATKAPTEDAKSKAVAEAKAKRNAQIFKNEATTITLYDRSGRAVGNLGERALYDTAVLSPDRQRVAVIKEDLDNESADLFVLDVATGATRRITTSVKTEFVMAPVWSPDGSHLAYVTIRNGQEGIYLRAADGQGPEELLYTHSGAFLDLSDWSLDGRFLTFEKSDLSGGILYVLPIRGDGEHVAREIFRTYSRIEGPRFSPDSRFLSYRVVGQSVLSGRGEIFVRPVDSSTGAEPWQISEGGLSTAFWRRDGKELYFVGLDRSLMVSDVKTAPTFTFTKPRALFRPPGTVSDIVSFVSSDGERFLALPPPRGPKLQQITVFDREGKVVKKVGEPGLYSQPAFSPDATRLAVIKEDLKSGQQDVWVMDIATRNSTQVTNDTLFKINPMWLPDGAHVLYASMHKGDWGIYRRASDGTGGEELLFRYTPGAFVNLTDISPDGKFLLCDSGGVVLTVPLAGSDPLTRKEIETLRNEFDNDVARLSPDGRFLAFMSDEAQAERGEVYIQPFDLSTGAVGDAKWLISKDGVNPMMSWRGDPMLAWRGDGKEVFFRGLDLDTNDLRVMAVDVNPTPEFRAAPPRLLFRLPGPLSGNLENVSRDGQRFVFAIDVPADASPVHTQ